MNESTLIQLKIIVERAVRPMRSSEAHKRKIREELLAHVSGVFEEEVTRGAERTALEQTARRFGNPADVMGQLQEAVPFSDRVMRFWEGRPDESTLRGALRLAWVFQLFVLFVSGASLLAAFWQYEWASGDQLALWSSLAYTLRLSIGPIYLFVIGFVAHAMEGSLRHPAGPPAGWPWISVKRTLAAIWTAPIVRWALIVACSCFLLLIGIWLAHGSSELTTWNTGMLVLAGVCFAGDAAATSIFAAWVLVQSADERRRYYEEWASLPIAPSA